MSSRIAAEPISVFCISHSASLGGAERSLADLVHGLSQRGVTCSVLLPHPGPLKGLLEAYQVNVYVSSVPYSWWASVSWEQSSDLDTALSYGQCVSEIVGLISSQKPDFILSQTLVTPWGALCASILGIPHVLSVREYGVRDHHLMFRYGFQASVDALYQDSALVFAITQDVAKELFPGDPLNKVKVIYGSVQVPDEDQRRSQSRPLRSSHNTDIYRVLILGNISEGKRQKDAVHAIALLRKSGFAIELRIVGPTNDAQYKDDLVTLAHEYGLQDCFEVLPVTEDPLQELCEADVLISCAPCEAMGRTLLEAALLGCPIVYPDSCGPGEIFINGEHGLAFSPGDTTDLARQISATISNQKETLERVAKAREYVRRKFSQDNYAGSVLSALVHQRAKKPSPSSNRVQNLLRNTPIEGITLELVQIHQNHQRQGIVLSEKMDEIEQLSAWGQSLEAELVQTRSEVGVRGDEIERLSIWGRGLEEELDRTRLEVGSRGSEIERLSSWGRGLEEELERTQLEVGVRGSEIERLSSWGRRLELELDQSGRTVKARGDEIEKLSAWGRGLEAELAQTRIDLKVQQDDVARLSAWGRGLDNELTLVRRLVEGRGEEIEQLSAWGRGLEDELIEVRTELGARGEEIERLSLWGQVLDTELAQTRKVVEARGDEIERLSGWGRALHDESLENRALALARGLEIERFKSSFFGKLYRLVHPKGK